MKILAIIGSPRRKGNTYKVVSLIEERMKALGDVEFSYLFLKDANLETMPGMLAVPLLGRVQDKIPVID